jgi:hypothetical protein
MQSTHWKLGLLVSVLHVALFIAITYLGLQPLDHGAQSAKSSQVIELRSADPQKRVANRSIAEPSPSRALGVAQPSSVRGDAAFISVLKLAAFAWKSFFGWPCFLDLRLLGAE